MRAGTLRNLQTVLTVGVKRVRVGNRAVAEDCRNTLAELDAVLPVLTKAVVQCKHRNIHPADTAFEEVGFVFDRCETNAVFQVAFESAVHERDVAECRTVAAVTRQRVAAQRGVDE